jgi:predicted DNA binding protein
MRNLSIALKSDLVLVGEELNRRDKLRLVKPPQPPPLPLVEPLTSYELRAIRLAYRRGLRAEDLSKEFCVSPRTILAVVKDV